MKAAAEQAKKLLRKPLGQNTHDFNSAEIDWFSRNSYNLALELCSTIQPQYLLRLCESCVMVSGVTHWIIHKLLTIPYLAT
jgi:hypothetical protein